MEKESAGYQKVQQYASQIKNGEERESVLGGLSPAFIEGINGELGAEQTSKNSNEQQDNLEQTLVPPQYEGMSAEAVDFIWTIPEYVDPQKTQQEKERKQKVVDSLRVKEAQAAQAKKSSFQDGVSLAEARSSLGIGVESQGVEEAKQKLVELEGTENIRSSVKGIVEYVTQGRSQAVLNLYKNFLENIDDLETRKGLIGGLFQDIYNKYRLAEYPNDPNEEAIWDKYKESSNVKVKISNNWQYRGVFPESGGSDTETRGSLNVRIETALIDTLDAMISSGEIKANYKFGEPGMATSSAERHDAITIYFLKKPSEEILEKIASTAKPYVRGDNLLGKKIADGFFMSEVGSIETSHIEDLVNTSANLDPAFSEALKSYTLPRADKGTTLKMSEAQYYAIKDVARAFGYEMNYDKEKGFDFNAAS